MAAFAKSKDQPSLDCHIRYAVIIDFRGVDLVNVERWITARNVQALF